MDLSDSELFWTRYHKGLVSMEETERYIRSLEKKIKELEENYIPKSLVRENIKELEKQMEKDEVDDFGIHSIGWSVLDYIIDYLRKKLLEGDK